MGLFDMLKGLTGRRTPRTGNPLIDAVLPMLLGGGALGGLGGLLSKFRGAGLGAKADSWVSTGRNEPLTSDEVTTALGSRTVDEVAAKAGVSKDQAAGGLASLLPGLVDKLTPGGAVPSGNLTKSLKRLDTGSLRTGG